MREMVYIPVSKRKKYAISLEEMYKEMAEETQVVLKKKCVYHKKPKVKKRKRG